MAPLPPIPEHLLDQANQIPFVSWLYDLPVLLRVKWHLKRLWEDHTGLKLTPTQCKRIQNSRTPPRDYVQN